jgi:type II secretory pathway predicted ATPase ExeA
MNSLTAPPDAPEPAYAASPATYLDLYGLSKPPFGGARDTAGYIMFRSRKRGFDILVDHIVIGSGLLLLQGSAGSGKTETMRTAAAIAAEAKQETIAVWRPPNGRITLAQLITAMTGAADPDDTMVKRPVIDPATGDEGPTEQELADQAIEHFLSAPRKVLLADDIDEMPPDCVRLLRSLAQRIPDEPGGSAMVLTSSTDLTDISKRPDLSSFAPMARKTIRLTPLIAAEIRQYIERSLWISGGTTRRLLSSDATKVLVNRSGGMPGVIDRLMENALNAGFARGDPVITAKTISGAIGPAPPRTAKRMNARSDILAVVIQVVAAGLLVTGVSVFLYKGLSVEPEQPKAQVADVPAPTAPPPVVAGPVPQQAAAARPAEPMAAELMAALMKRGDQALDLGDVAAARLLFQRAADAGNAAAATAMGRSYDPNYATPGAKPDPVRAAEWYRRAIGLGDIHAGELLKRLASR